MNMLYFLTAIRDKTREVGFSIQALGATLRRKVGAQVQPCIAARVDTVRRGPPRRQTFGYAARGQHVLSSAPFQKQTRKKT